MSTAVRLRFVDGFFRLALTIGVGCAALPECYGGEAAAPPQTAPLSPAARAWLDEYGGTWGSISRQGSEDVGKTYLIFAADEKGALRIEGYLERIDPNDNSVSTCSIAPPSSFEFGSTQWTWNDKNNEICRLRIERSGADLKIGFSGCGYVCTSRADFSNMLLKRLSAQPMQPLSDTILGICVSDNSVQRQLCLSPKLRQSSTEYTALGEQAREVLSEKSLPPEEEQLVLQFVGNCNDIACVEDAQARANRELRQRVDEAVAATISSAKFLPLPKTLYRGKFGNSEATVCISVDDKGGLEGSYYDEKIGKTMTLRRAAPSATEPAPQVMERLKSKEYEYFGAWQFNELSINRISGIHRDLKTGVDAVFDMGKMAVAADCDKALAASRRFAESIVVRKRIGGLDLVTYKNQWAGNDVIGLRIESGLSDAVRKKINNALKEPVDEANEYWFTLDEENFEQTPILLSKTVLSISQRDERSGISHNYYDWFVANFDIRTGERMDIYKWIDQAVFKQSIRRGAIRQELLNGEMSDECLKDERDYGFFWGGSFSLSTKFITFTVSTSIPLFLMCSGDYEIKFNTFRSVLLSKAIPIYDRYIADMKKSGIMINWPSRVE